MVSPITWIKLKAFNSILNSVNIKIIADVIEDFGTKQFGSGKDSYLDQIRTKLSNLVFEIGKRIK